MEICGECRSDIDPAAGGFASPDLGMAGAIIRRVNPAAWPKRGIPPSYRNYASLYEILLVKTKETDDGEPAIWTLPAASTRFGMDPQTSVLGAWPQVKAKRALYVDAVAVPDMAFTLLLFCLPIDKDGESHDFSGLRGAWPNSAFFPLTALLSGLRALRPLTVPLAEDARLCLVSLDRWLAETHRDAVSVALLWRTPAYLRVCRQDENRLHNTRGTHPSLPAAKVVRNPLYHSGLVVLPPDDIQSDDFVLGDESTDVPLSGAAAERPAPPAGEARLWGDRYPIHRAACEGDVETLRRLVKEGRSAASPDSDSWTPLHYAAWHGHEGVVRILMEDWQGAPAARTDSGCTALHFAARNGWVELVRILLACPIVSPNLQDNDKHTPLWLCEHMQLNQWEEVSRMLRNPQGLAAVNRFSYSPSAGGVTEMVEHRIFLMDGSVKVLRLPSGDQTTAEMLRNAVAGILNVAEESWHVFAIWVVSASIEFQLEPDMKPGKRLKRWQEMIELYGESGVDDHPVLFFKRNSYLSLADERKTRSPVALKFLFDEAVHALLRSLWAVTVDQAIHLAALLMQIRFGDFTEEYYRTSFLADGLHTLVPAHLLHNQLRTSEWQRRIAAAHKDHSGKHDISLLQRLFLQYCWQWSFYGSVFFKATMSRAGKKTLFSKEEDVRIGVNTEWLTVFGTDHNIVRLALNHDDYRYSLEENNIVLSVDISGIDRSKLETFVEFNKTHTDTLCISSRQAFLLTQYLDNITVARREAERAQQRLRMEQGGPQVLRHVSKGPADISAPEREFESRLARERLARYHLLHSFGSAIVDQKCAAQAVFDRFCKEEPGLAKISDLKAVFYELGYWLGVEYDDDVRIFNSYEGETSSGGKTPSD
eukprot:m.182740 g.182740  ORF g.182740 m.182740 type:complete len:876 (-) comp15382_c1_seq1:2434-5061(-)